MNRYENLLNIKCKKCLLLKFILLFIVIILYFLHTLDTYDKYTFYAIVENNFLKIEIPVNNSDNIKSGEFLKVKNKKYKFNVVNITKNYIQNDIIYQTYYIEIDKNYLENEIIEITIYTNKEKIIKKIIKMFF